MPRFYRLGLMAVFVLLGVLLRVGLHGGVVTRTPDERNYTQEAQVLLHNGDRGFPLLTEQYRLDPGIPSPARAGYLLLLSHTMQLVQDDSPAAGADLSCVASILCVLLAAVFAWRVLPFAGALAAMLLYAVSPFALMTSRRGWEESVVEAASLALLLVAAEINLGKRGVAWYALFAAVGAFAVTLKEVGAIAFFFAALWVVADLLLRRERKQALLFAGCCLVAVELSLLWLAHLVGGFDVLAQFTAMATQALNASDYSKAYEGGPPWLMLEAIVRMSLSTLLAFAAIPAVVWWRDGTRERRIVHIGLLIFSAAIVLLTLVTPHHLNLRYVCPVFAPLAILGGLGFCFLLGSLSSFPRTTRNALTAALFVLVLAVAAYDTTRFQQHFIANDTQDLSVRMVLLPASGAP